MLAAQVPLAFVNMPPGHFDFVDERHGLERHGSRVVPRRQN
ncbi:hypothetical protein [Mesorhizobium sp.]|nr:hypothetical protein [Mesorhizobium sp.]